MFTNSFYNDASPGRVSHARCALGTFIQQLSQPNTADSLGFWHPKYIWHTWKLLSPIWDFYKRRLETKESIMPELWKVSLGVTEKADEEEQPPKVDSLCFSVLTASPAKAFHIKVFPSTSLVSQMIPRAPKAIWRDVTAYSEDWGKWPRLTVDFYVLTARRKQDLIWTTSRYKYLQRASPTIAPSPVAMSHCGTMSQHTLCTIHRH